METKVTSEERQAFLAKTRVGIISIPEEGHGPLDGACVVQLPAWRAGVRLDWYKNV